MMSGRPGGLSVDVLSDISTELSLTHAVANFGCAHERSRGSAKCVDVFAGVVAVHVVFALIVRWNKKCVSQVAKQVKRFVLTS